MILTRLLPSRMPPISRSFRPSSASTTAARRSPCFASECIRGREAAVRAVSEPEKNADNTSKTKMIPAVISNSCIMLPPLLP